MQPLLPKIKTGDILHGTRNLRHWLTGCRKLAQLSGTDGGMSTSFVTQKEDAYIVICNRQPLFSVWSPQNQATLVFTTVNPGHGYLPTLGMTPSTFPFWFIRTLGRNTNLNTWPPHAEFLWRALHLRSVSLTTPFVMSLRQGGLETPFLIHKNTNEAAREKYRSLSKQFLSGKRRKEAKISVLEVPWQPKETDLHKFRYTIMNLSEVLENQKPNKLKELKSSPFLNCKVSLAIKKDSF